MSIRILIVDDHKIVCDGLKMIIEHQSDWLVVGVANTGREAIRAIPELRPDLVIIDVVMPDLNGVEASRQILREHPRLKLIALSMHADKRYVSGMLEAGVHAYLLKDCAAEELTWAIRTVMGGKRFISPSISNIVVEGFVQGAETRSSPARGSLTAREREVLQLLAEGRSTREAAQSLSVSTKTIETHRRQIMEKLELHSIAELTKYAIREGLTSL